MKSKKSVYDASGRLFSILSGRFIFLRISLASAGRCAGMSYVPSNICSCTSGSCNSLCQYSDAKGVSFACVKWHCCHFKSMTSTIFWSVTLCQLITSSPLSNSMRCQIVSIFIWSKSRWYGRWYSLIAGISMLVGPPLDLGFKVEFKRKAWFRCFSICMRLLISLAASVPFDAATSLANSIWKSFLFCFDCFFNSRYLLFASLYCTDASLNVSIALTRLVSNVIFDALVKRVFLCRRSSSASIVSGHQSSIWCELTFVHLLSAPTIISVICLSRQLFFFSKSSGSSEYLVALRSLNFWLMLWYFQFVCNASRYFFVRFGIVDFSRRKSLYTREISSFWKSIDAFISTKRPRWSESHICPKGENPAYDILSSICCVHHTWSIACEPRAWVRGRLLFWKRCSNTLYNPTDSNCDDIASGEYIRSLKSPPSNILWPRSMHGRISLHKSIRTCFLGSTRIPSASYKQFCWYQAVHVPLEFSLPAFTRYIVYTLVTIWCCPNSCHTHLPYLSNPSRKYLIFKLASKPDAIPPGWYIERLG